MTAPQPSRTDLPFGEALRELLERQSNGEPLGQPTPGRRRRRATLNALAAQIGVTQPHLWRIVNRPGERRPSPELIASVAVAFGLPADYFIETREVAVERYLRRHPERLNELYDESVHPEADRSELGDA